jgi:co-chaperonin GroES (HSP10)
MSFTSKIHIKVDYKKITPTRNNILVTDMDIGERVSSGGVIIIGDNMEERGIRPRWCKVVSVGPKNKDVKKGEYILVAHGRWSRGLDMTDPVTGETTTIRMVDPKDVLLASKKRPTDDFVGATYHQRD